MVDKITINPLDVRGAGDIVSPKTAYDFGFYNSYVNQTTALVNGVPMTVFNMGSRSQESLELDFDKFVNYTEDLNSFPLRATLKNSNGNPLVGKRLTCTVNGVDVYSANTNSRGQVVFNVPVKYSGGYYCTVQYITQTGSNVGGATRSVKVFVGELNSITLNASQNPVGTGDLSALVCNVDCLIDDERVPAPNVPVNFYEEYIMDKLRITSGDTVQDGDVLPLTARLSDVDGSAIPDQTVEFYEEWESGDLVFVNPVDIIQSGTVLPVSARLTDLDGSGISGETIMFYEEYETDHLNLKLGKTVIESDEVATISATLHDRDGSLIQVAGTTVRFYEEYSISDVNLFVDKSVIIPDERVVLSASVRDEDGSAIPNQTVFFYEEFERTNLNVSFSKNTLTSSEESEFIALLRDSDGSRVRDSMVEFTEELDSTDWQLWFDEIDRIDTVQDGDTVPVSANVYNENGEPVSDVYVRFVADMNGEEVIVPEPEPEPEPVLPVGSVTLVGGGNKILSAYDEDTALLTVTVKDTANNVMEGESVVFKANGEVLDTKVTDSTGVATYTYTAQGSGDVEFTAEVGSLVSETYSIEDCTYFNDGSSVNGLDIGSNVSCTSNGEYITITTSTSGEKYVKLPVTLTNLDNWEYNVEIAKIGTNQSLAICYMNSDGWAGNRESAHNWFLDSRNVLTQQSQVGDVLTILKQNSNVSMKLNGTEIATTTKTFPTTYWIGLYTNNRRVQHIKNITLKLV